MGGSDKGNDHPCQSGQEVGEPEKDLQVPWGGKCCCHPSTQLLSTLLIRLVLLMLVLLVIRPWLLFHWLPEITIADADVVQDGATGSHLDCKDRARACHGALF
uniref:Uncharacterized protein n=1 Tax=Knipowitschia caucasica TaxID=637954 RepID=A0AAV2MI14_KNICA